jgi:vanillate O-demethylase ferredoxin subunit
MNPAPLIRVRVASKTPLATDIALFELHAADGGALPAFKAGAHVEVHVGQGDARFVRPYSLCNAPGETHRWQIAVLRTADSRGGSAAVHAWLREGSTFEASVPRNLFPLAPSTTGAARSLLIAGGIGITPLLAMAETLHARGAAFELHHCTRSLARTPFVERVAAAPWGPSVHRHLDDGDAGQRLDLPALLAAQPTGTHLYVCGPQGFMEAVLAAARAAAWPEAQLHWESFSPEVTHEPGDRAFELVLQRSGIILTVGAEQTAAQAIADAGVFLPTSCEQGICGTCLTPVLDGEPDHRDQYLTPEERAANDQFTPCCSRARGARLVIDL